MSMTGEPAAPSAPAPSCAILPLPYALALLAIAAVAMLPALVGGAMVGAHDTHHHLRWQAHFADLLWSGLPYPRWLPNVNEGFGSPVFFIYPPLAHYVGALFRPILPGPEGMVLRVALSATVALAIGGWGIALWLRERGASPAARLVGATTYMLAPYHLYADTYLRGALGELWAFAPLPFILAGIAAQVRRPLHGLIATSVATAALVLSHAPSLLIVLPAACLYALLLAVSERRPVVLPRTALALLLGFALAAPYLATALTQGSLIAAWNLFDDYFRPSRWLLGSDDPWPSPDVGLPILTVFLVQVGVALLLLVQLGRTGWRNADRLFALILLGGTILLATEAGRWFWQLETPLNRIQFPWRLLMLQAIPLAVLAARSWERSARGQRLVPLAAILSLVLANVALGDRVLPWRTTPVEIFDWQTYWEPPEYVLGGPWELSLLFADGAKTVTLDAPAQVEVTRWNSRRIGLDVATVAPVRLALRQYAYSGWRYRIDGGATQDAGRWSDERPVVTIHVPPGRHEIDVWMPATLAERLGWTASAAALLVLGWLVWIARHPSVLRRG